MSSLSNRCVLLIDDDPLIRRIVTKSLTAAGYLVMEAATGVDGIEKAKQRPPDIVLLDLMLPGIDGYEVCAQLRRDTKTANVPVIMLTALDQSEAKVRGLRVGADDYMTKPFDLDELQMRIEAHLRRSLRDQSASPLTSLPGNIMIEQTLRERIMLHEPLAVLYIDLTNFKAYNDEYGWLRGDDIIKMLAAQILQAIQTHGGKRDFVGHVGGDDFVVISTPEFAEAIAQTVITCFDAEVPKYYGDDARERGYIDAVDRKGNAFRAPIVTVSIAIVTNQQRELQHPGQVASQAAELKRYVKSLPGSQYAFDRRRK